MKYLFLFCLLGSWVPCLHAQTPAVSALNYSIFSLPDSLKKNAGAVYRLEEAILDIQSPSKYVVTYHSIVTLLNKDAAHHLRQRFYFDKVNKIEDLEIKLFDAAGIEVKRYRKKDFEITNYDDHESMVLDDKVMNLDIPPIAYPFTLELTSQTNNSSYIELPDWRPGAIGAAVQLSRFSVRVPKDLDIQYKSWHIPNKPYITVTGNIKTYQWEIKNRMASTIEAGGYEARFRVPRVLIVPSYFEYDGLKGQLNSWENLGKWMYPLYDDPKAFSPYRQAEIKALVKDCTNDREKIKVLYEHLQKNMRYVSIQLGIGGFKPFPVSFVDDKKYGDCKALTNYMRYMLKTVGINAYPALINAGYTNMPADPAFPADVFNHVILCVPAGKDSVWLECTSTSKVPGILGTSTENKYALLLTEEGGKLVPTPKSKSANSQQVTTTTIVLNSEGGATVSSSIYCTGEFWDQAYYFFQQNKDDLKNIFVRYLQYRSPDNFELSQPADSAKGHHFQLKLNYDQLYEFKAGPKFFVRPRIHPICLEDMPLLKERKDEYLLHFPYEKTDTTIFILPPGFQPDNLHPVKTINSQYGQFRQEMIYDEGKRMLRVIAELSLRYHTIPPADYAGIAEFFHAVNKQESEKLVLKSE